MLLHLVSSVLCTVVLVNQAPTEPGASDTLFPVERWAYSQEGRRDPFVPLGLALEGGKVGHLSVENLTLIGVIWGDKGYIGLVKDGLNKGYILKPGDRVAGGSVAEINNQGIVFDIVHAGVTTKYELRLQQKERR